MGAHCRWLGWVQWVASSARFRGADTVGPVHPVLGSHRLCPTQQDQNTSTKDESARGVMSSPRFAWKAGTSEGLGETRTVVGVWRHVFCIILHLGTLQEKRIPELQRNAQARIRKSGESMPEQGRGREPSRERAGDRGGRGVRPPGRAEWVVEAGPPCPSCPRVVPPTRSHSSSGRSL